MKTSNIDSIIENWKNGEYPLEEQMLWVLNRLVEETRQEIRELVGGMESTGWSEENGKRKNHIYREDLLDKLND